MEVVIKKDLLQHQPIIDSKQLETRVGKFFTTLVFQTLNSNFIEYKTVSYYHCNFFAFLSNKLFAKQS